MRTTKQVNTTGKNRKESNYTKDFQGVEKENKKTKRLALVRLLD